jgi:hypothetical protein
MYECVVDLRICVNGRATIDALPSCLRILPIHHVIGPKPIYNSRWIEEPGGHPAARPFVPDRAWEAMTVEPCVQTGKGGIADFAGESLTARG